MSWLHLNLRAEYFDAIRDGEKTEEFRRVTAYWIRRLEGRSFEGIRLMKGYPSRNDATRILERAWRGFERKTITHPHFGDLAVEVFAISVSWDPLGTAPDGVCRGFSES